MTIAFEKPTHARNFTKTALHGVLALLETLPASGPNIANIVLHLYEAVKATEHVQSESPPNRAWVWASRTLSYAAAEILAHARQAAPLAAEADEATERFLEAATQFGDATLDQIALRNPPLSAAFDPAKKALRQFLREATTAHKLDLDTLDARFARALRTASNRVVCEDPAYFRPLEDALLGAWGEAARREAAWARHHFWIAAQHTDQPVFSPDETETTPLAAVYLRLRCFWNEEIPVETDDPRRPETRRTAHVAKLHETAADWLKGDARRDPIRVVVGGPGSGKSSFARAFAGEVVAEGGHRVVLIRLQHTRLSGALDRDVEEYSRRYHSVTTGKGDPGLPASPLDWRREDDAPLLLIFDGLDELAAEEEAAKRHAREFLLGLERLLSPLNRDGSPIRALVLGRNATCEAALEAANLPLTTMLNVAPIAPMTRETCRLSANRDKNYADPDLFDPDALMERDQRETYWRRWVAAKGLDASEVPPPITAPSMAALNLEPLLLHLLIISKYCGPDWPEAADNRNLVYEDILEKIYERNRKKAHFAAHGLDRGDFFLLMECLGLAAWRGNGRTGGEEDFREVRKLHARKEKRFKAIPAASLDSVALNIHTRPGGREEEDGFEFIHKSFGEYLAARGLLSHAMMVARDLSNDTEPEDAAKPWTALIAAAELTDFIIVFLYDEARLRLTPERAQTDKRALTELLQWIQAQGAPAHRVFDGLTWRELETRQRCTESALFAALSAVATVIPRAEDLSGDPRPWTVDIGTGAETFDPARFLERIGATTRMPVAKACKRINLAQMDLFWLALIDANLFEADLRKTNLVGANLSSSNLRGANLHRATLLAAYLLQADLRNAAICEADLSEADLREADLRNADLRGADLREADLREANLRTANLHDADLREADLRIADLRDVDWKSARMDACDIQAADLSKSLNLTLDQVNAAKGNSDTLLPDYIDRSQVVWLQDKD